MPRNMQIPTRTRFDLIFSEDGLVTIGELKGASGDVIGYWWTSGLNASGQLVLLGEHQILWSAGGQPPEVTAKSIYESHVLPLARGASQAKGIPALTPIWDPAFRTALLTEHLAIHRELKTYSDEKDGVVASIAKQYQLAESFIAATTVEFLAAWNDLPASTIRKRLERARQAGLIVRRQSHSERWVRG